MIHEVDESLKVLITGEALNGGVDVSFDAPTREWAARSGSPTINVFLYDIREDLGRRDVAPREIRNDAGRVVDRQAPPRRFKLSYLLTAWTQRPEDEHRLLSVLLARFLTFDAIPQQYLTGSLAELNIPVVLTLALPAGPERSLSDIWSALGGELKPSLDLNVIAPIDPTRSFETGPLVIEEPTITVAGARRNVLPDGTDEVVAGSTKPGRTLRVSSSARS